MPDLPYSLISPKILIMQDSREILQEGIYCRAARNEDGEGIREMIFSILREYGLEPDPSGTDLDLYDIEANYAKRGGLFEILEDADGRLLGSSALYPMDGEIVELRKMYFLPGLRGRGIGKIMLQKMIGEAKKMGFKKIYLETASPLEAAIALYKKFGFEPSCERHSPRCDQAFSLDI